jgi:hypothetical protein
VVVLKVPARTVGWRRAAPPAGPPPFLVPESGRGTTASFLNVKRSLSRGSAGSSPSALSSVNPAAIVPRRGFAWPVRISGGPSRLPCAPLKIMPEAGTETVLCHLPGIAPRHKNRLMISLSSRWPLCLDRTAAPRTRLPCRQKACPLTVLGSNIGRPHRCRRGLFHLTRPSSHTAW